MKYLLSILFLICTGAIAGDYHDSRVDTYDPASGLYYKSVYFQAKEKSFLSSSTQRSTININIFDPVSGTSTLLFKDAQKVGISVVLVESGFKDGTVQFNGGSYSSVPAMNNAQIEKREPRNKLLVGVPNNEANELTLFVSDKKGVGLKKLVTLPAKADWHIDVKNSKLRVVNQTGTGIQIDSYEW